MRRYTLGCVLLVLLLLSAIPTSTSSAADPCPPLASIAVDLNADGIPDGERQPVYIDGDCVPDGLITQIGGPTTELQPGDKGYVPPKASAARTAPGISYKCYMRPVTKKFTRDYILKVILYWRITLIKRWCGWWDSINQVGDVANQSALLDTRTLVNWDVLYARKKTTRVVGRQEVRDTTVKAGFRGGLAIKGTGIVRTDRIVFGLRVRADGHSSTWSTWVNPG